MALKPLNGVKKLDVDFGTRRATCTVDPKQFDSKKALELLAEVGYDEAFIEPPQ